jgi:geranylgeranyl diphosphate synthase, type II
MPLSTYLYDKQQLIEQKLNELVPENPALAFHQLFKAARYAIMSGGKRLRPILTIATAESLGGCGNAALGPACALEMIHTYSLIHDDLPCMDDDDFRRGKPSVHKAFTEGHAVLAGDFLLTYAFEVITNDPRLEQDQKIALITLLAKSAGGHGMIAGQVMDIEAEAQEVGIEKLQQIHKLKTGAMITAAIEFGAIVAGSSAAERGALRCFGEDLGLAFQIIDDVIDVTDSMQKHGRMVSSDEINNKSTYATLLGLEPARQTAYDLLARATEQLDNLPYDTSILKEISEKLVFRKS